MTSEQLSELRRRVNITGITKPEETLALIDEVERLRILDNDRIWFIDRNSVLQAQRDDALAKARLWKERALTYLPCHPEWHDEDKELEEKGD